MEKISCDLCGSPNHEFLFSEDDHLFGISGKFSVVKCNECELLFTNPRPTMSEMSKFYPKIYPSFEKKTIQKKQFGLKEKIIKILFEEYYNYPSSKKRVIRKIGIFPFFAFFELFVKEPLFLNYSGSGKILDIGCGSGSWLLKMKKNGWDPYGVEINKIPFENAKKVLGKNVFLGTVENAKFKKNFFDAIVLDNVLEHLHKPSDTLKEIKKILNKDGMLAIALPNNKGFSMRVFGKKSYLWQLPTHLYHFSPKTITKLLEKNDFEVKRIVFWNPKNIILNSLKISVKNKVVYQTQNPESYSKKGLKQDFKSIFRKLFQLLVRFFDIPLGILGLSDVLVVYAKPKKGPFQQQKGNL